MDDRLRVLDISDPFHLRLTATQYRLNFSSSFIELLDDRAYILASGSGAVYIFNIANPDDPGLVKVSGSGSAVNIKIKGNRLYEANESRGFRIWSLADRDNPSVLGSLANIECHDISVVGDLLCFASGVNGLRIADISDPAHPAVIGGGALNRAAFVESKGNHVFVAGGDILKIFDITNPVAPSLVYSNTFQAGVSARALTLSDNLLGISHFRGAIFYDVSNPSNPVALPSLAKAELQDLKIQGQYLYASSWQSGFTIYDISNPSNRVRLGTYECNSSPTLVYVSGNRAYEQDSFNGFRIFDISISSSPKYLYTHKSTDDFGYTPSRCVTASGNKAYLGFYGGFDIVDVSNSTNLLVNGRFLGRAPHAALALIGNYLYTGNGEIVDVTDPANPKLAAYFNAPANIWTFETSGALIYYNAETEIGILDVTIPLAPVLRGTKALVPTDMRFMHNRTTLSWPYWYTLLGIYDVSSPDEIKTTTSPPPSGQLLASAGQKLFAVEGSFLRQMEIRNQPTPVLVQSIQVPYPYSMAAQGNFLYQLDQGGLSIYEAALPPPPDRPNLEFIDDGPNIVLRWSSGYSGFNLYGASSLDEPWQIVTSSPYLTPYFYLYTNRFPLGTRFYKLIK